MVSCTDNLAKKIPTATFSPTDVKKLYKSLYYVCNLTNQHLVKIPSGKYKGYGIATADIKSMNTRLGNFIKNNGKNPNYVNILTPTNINIGSNLNNEQRKFLNMINSVFGKHSTAKSFTNKFRSTGYAFYLNAYEIAKGKGSQGNLTNSINRFKNKIGQNCCDLTLIVVAWLFLNGYQVEICQTECDGNYTHLYCRAKGKELGNKWVNIDIAPMASKTAPRIEFGRMGFCHRNGNPKKLIATNPKWYINMYFNALKAIGFVK